MTGGAFHQFVIVLYLTLGVASEEVDLDACYSYRLAPCEFAFAVLGLVQSELRSWSAIDLASRGVVPYHRFHAFRLGVADSIFNGLAVLHLVPFGIDKDIREAEFNGHVDILTDDIVVVAAVVMRPINP